MKKIFYSIIVITATASQVTAQVKIPFDVPVPTWEMLVTAKDADNQPIINQKPNSSSDILVSQCGEDCNYQWSPRSAIPEWWGMVQVSAYENLPVISQEKSWVKVEYNTDSGDFSGWCPAYGLRKVTTFKMTIKDVIASDFMLPWEADNDLYVVVEGGGGTNYVNYHVGKLKDGYVVCPYICVLELDNTSEHPGILNGVVGNNSSLSKFTRRDVEYIMNNAAEDSNGPLVVYGYMNTEGARSYNWLLSHLVSFLPGSGAQSDIKGAIIESVIVKNKEVSTMTQADDRTVYSSTDTPASFPGGNAALFTHIAKNQKYPSLAQENGEQGKVIVSFVIEKDGSVGDVKIKKSVSQSLDKEAIRVVKTLPKFTPAKNGGKTVRSEMSIPVTFRLK